MIVLLFVTAVPAALAAEQTGGLAETTHWTLSEPRWQDRRGLPTEATYVGPLTAHYNMAYGATVLGLNLLVSGSGYYAVCASSLQDRLTSLTDLGPLSQPVQWDSGPYFLAAGLPDGRLQVWLTAPREYPRQVTVSTQYEPNTPFACQVAPPAPPSAEWKQWTITVAFQRRGLSPRLAVETSDGDGKLRSSLPLLDVSEPLADVTCAGIPLSEQTSPFVLLADAKGLSALWHDSLRGWQAQAMHHGQLSSVQLHLPVGPLPGSALVSFLNPEDSYGGRHVQLVDISVDGGKELSARWGRADKLPLELEPLRLVAFDTVRSAWPLLAGATTADVFLFYRSAAAEPRVRGLELSTVRLHYGDRLPSADYSTAAYPILGIAAAAHWRSGDPEVYWVQLGSDHADGGQLLCLAYEPHSS